MQNTSQTCIKQRRNCISTYTVHRLKHTVHRELETILGVLPAQTWNLKTFLKNHLLHSLIQYTLLIVKRVQHRLDVYIDNWIRLSHAPGVGCGLQAPYMAIENGAYSYIYSRYARRAVTSCIRVISNLPAKAEGIRGKTYRMYRIQWARDTLARGTVLTGGMCYR